MPQVETPEQLEVRNQKNRARALAHYWANRDQKLQYQKNYQAENRTHIIAYKAEYRKKNAARIALSNAEYIQREPEGVRQRRLKRNSDYRKRNLAKYAAHTRRRIALKALVSVNPKGIEAWWNKIRSSKSVACYYCGTVMNGNSMHMDHVIPLKLGGSHSIGNCCAACAPCNLSKNATLPSEWNKIPQRVFSL